MKNKIELWHGKDYEPPAFTEIVYIKNGMRYSGTIDDAGQIHRDLEIGQIEPIIDNIEDISQWRDK